MPATLRPLLLLLLVFTAFAVNVAVGQHPLEPSDTSSPRSTLNGLIAASNELHRLIVDRRLDGGSGAELLPASERLRDCLDLSELPRELRLRAGMETAIFIKEVLDRVELPAEDAIPDAQGMFAPAGGGEEVRAWRIPGTRLTIARVERDFGPSYQFTAETVRRAGEYYRIAKMLPYREGGQPTSPGLHDAYIAATKQQPQRTADTSSPRGTITLFLDSFDKLVEELSQQQAMDRGSPQRQPLVSSILACLDASEFPDYAREDFAKEAAVYLKEVLDRVDLPPAEAIPGIEVVETADGGQPLIRWQVPHTQITIARVADGPRRGEYLFTPETLRRVRELYAKIKDQPYRRAGRSEFENLVDWYLSYPGNPSVVALVDRLPDWVRRRTLGLAAWQWIGLLIAAPLALAVVAAAYRAGRVRAQLMRRRSLWRYWLTLVFPVVSLLTPLAFKYFAWEYLTFRGTPLYVASFLADTVFLLAVIGLIVACSNRVAESIIALPNVNPEGLNADLIRIVARVVAIVGAGVVFLEGGRYFGFPLTTLLASAGIGGLAIALAAQGVVKNLFGTVTILCDKPYRVGERIVVKGHDGVVEQIGLRSTKIRSFLTHHLIAIPNDHIADSEVENVGRRQHIRRLADLHIPLDTPREKVERALALVREVLADHEQMDPDYPPRVYFTEFNADSFNIRFMYWYASQNVWDFQAFSERVNLAIFRVFEAHGISFSLPFRHSYWKSDGAQGPLDVRVVEPPAAGRHESASPSPR